MARARGGRRGGGHGEEEGGDERWLLSYADMMTLLVALFMVLFSISSVNTSKYEGLQRSLKDAFSGKVLPGGTSIASAGGSATDKQVIAPPQTTSPQPQVGGQSDPGDKAQQAAAKAEGDRFARLKRQLDAYAAKAGIAGQVTTRLSRDGLHIRVLTDKLLFDSGSATPKAPSLGLLGTLGTVLAAERTHRVVVEGHTDSRPMSSGQYPSNWELSAARAAAIVRSLLQAGVAPDRLTASGRADRAAVTSNDTEAGRQLNRRVEILLPRDAALTAPTAPDAGATTSPPVAAGDPDLTHPLGTRIVPLPATEARP